MPLFARSTGRRNLQRVIHSASEFVNQSIPGTEASLCVATIEENLRSLLLTKQNEREAAKWSDDFDYAMFGVKSLYTVCFRLLASGRLHIWRGSLSPEGDAVYSLFIQVLSVYEEAGLLQGTCTEEQLDIIDEAIASVG